MCTQVNTLFSCGHRGFERFDKCAGYGRTCMGASGVHKDNPADRDCSTCQVRKTDEANGFSKKDPWWENDPWRKQRTEK